MEARFSRSGPLVGTIRPPSDKSLTHRAFLFAGLAKGSSQIHQPLLGEDCISTLKCLESMGAIWELTEHGVHLTPAQEWSQPKGELDCGNSGTTMRLLAGLLASRPLDVTMMGDASLSKRPMKRIAEPLRLMGATVEGDRPPLRVIGANLKAIDYESPVASAQVKSCVLLAGLRASGTTSVTEPSLSRDHTERMLTSLGVDVRREGLKVSVEPGAVWSGFDMAIPADISSAAFWLVAALVVPGSNVNLMEVGVNPTRTGILDVFEQAGASYEVHMMDEAMGEPVAEINARFSGDLRPFTIEGGLVPRLIDEIPVLAVLATQCLGTTIIRDAQELTVKESNRITVVAEHLNAMGAKVTPTEDGMVIEGPTPLRGTVVQAGGDHRIAMAFAVAGLIADGETVISGFDSVATSYPDFCAHLEVLRS